MRQLEVATDTLPMTCRNSGHQQRVSGWIAWLPFVSVPVLCLLASHQLEPWAFMWILAATIFFCCKWQTWCCAGSVGESPFRSAGYLFLWPGMDAESFLDPSRPAQRVTLTEWAQAAAKAMLGIAFIWGAAPAVPAGHDVLTGWVVMIGLVLILHFGSFHLLSLLWRSAGVDAPPLMRAPLASTSLAEFWGRRWNLGFRQLTHAFIFRPARMRFGLPVALLLSFLVSGLVHDLVISLPAGAGYGLPTAYFLLQGAGVLMERSRVGQLLRLSQGIRGWLFMAAFTAIPLPLLFHEPFIRQVILPFTSALGAR